MATEEIQRRITIVFFSQMRFESQLIEICSDKISNIAPGRALIVRNQANNLFASRNLAISVQIAKIIMMPNTNQLSIHDSNCCNWLIVPTHTYNVPSN